MTAEKNRPPGFFFSVWAPPSEVHPQGGRRVEKKGPAADVGGSQQARGEQRTIAHTPRVVFTSEGEMAAGQLGAQGFNGEKKTQRKKHGSLRFCGAFRSHTYSHLRLGTGRRGNSIPPIKKSNQKPLAVASIRCRLSGISIVVTSKCGLYQTRDFIFGYTATRHRGAMLRFLADSVMAVMPLTSPSRLSSDLFPTTR